MNIIQHPLFKTISSAIRRYGMISAGDIVLCGFSGGADSSCLLALLREYAAENNVSLHAMHVNHCLRGAESDADEAFCRRVCLAYNVPFLAERTDVSAFAAANRLSVETAAREQRYSLLKRHAAEIGAAVVALAHNADDNAETMLINMLRGSGTAGFSGIPPIRRDNNISFVRPLICASRDSIERFCHDLSLNYVTDSSNLSDDYTRNRLRHAVLPVLKELNPAFLSVASRESGILRAENEYLDKIADIAYDTCVKGSVLRLEQYFALDKAVAARVSRIYLERHGISGASTHAQAILALAESKCPSATASLPGGLVAAREYDCIRIRIRTETRDYEDFTLPVTDGMDITVNGWNIRAEICENPAIFNHSVNTFYLGCDKIRNTLELRTRKAGDELILPGGTKSLKKLMIDRKIPRAERSHTPVFADGDAVCAVPGIGVSVPYRITNGSTTTLPSGRTWRIVALHGSAEV